MAIFNMTELANADSISKIVDFSDSASGNVMIPAFIIAIVLIVMIVTTRRNEPEEAVLYSLFVGFLLSGIIWYGGLLNWMFPAGFLVIFAAFGLYRYVRG